MAFTNDYMKQLAQQQAQYNQLSNLYNNYMNSARYYAGSTTQQKQDKDEESKLLLLEDI